MAKRANRPAPEREPVLTVGTANGGGGVARPVRGQVTPSPLVDALRHFEDARRARRCGQVAILGPPRSGKSALLDSISVELSGRRKPAFTQLRLDLAKERFDRFDDPSRQLARCLRADHLIEDPAWRLRAGQRQQGGPSLYDLLKHLLCARTDRFFLLEIDHLESAPHDFARALAQDLHPLLEINQGPDDEDDTTRRLGLLVCGSISLQDLLADLKSGFIHCKPVRMPPSLPNVREEAVRRLSRQWGMPLDEGAVRTLAEWTGGEPAFAVNVLNLLRPDGTPPATEVNAAAVREAAERLSGLDLQLALFHDIALEIHRDPNLRNAARELLDNRPVWRPSILKDDDISRFELTGVFVRQGERYEFRNGMVRHFVKQILDKADLLSTWSFSGGPPPKLTQAERALQLPLRLAATARAARTEANIWSLLPLLADLFGELKPYPKAVLTLYSNGPAGWWRLDAVEKQAVQVSIEKLTETPVGRSAVNADRLAREAEASHRSTDGLASFDADDRRLVAAVPLGPAPRRAVLVVAVDRGGAGMAWSESSLTNWLWFLHQQVGSLLSVLTAVEAAEAAATTATVAPQRDSRVLMACTLLLPRTGAPALIDPPALHQAGPGEAGDRSCAERFAEVVNGLDALNDECLTLGDIAGTGQRSAYLQCVRKLAERVGDAFKRVDPVLFDALGRIPKDCTLNVAGDLGMLRLPVEILPVGRRPLGLDVGVARQVSLPNGRGPHTRMGLDRLLAERARHRRPVRVLIVASGEGLPHVQEEVRDVEATVRERIGAFGAVAEVRLLGGPSGPEATVQEVAAALEGGTWDLFHFAGHGAHGGPAEPDGRTGIQLRSDRGYRVVTTSELAGWLGRAKPWLVYLSACSTAAQSKLDGDTVGTQFRRHLSTIEAVLEAGVPAVVGFRWEIPDRDAARIAGHFYHALLDHDRGVNPAIAMRDAAGKVESDCASWAAALVVCQLAAG